MPDSDEEQITENYHVTAFTNPDYPVVTGDKNIQVFKWGLSLSGQKRGMMPKKYGR